MTVNKENRPIFRPPFSLTRVAIEAIAIFGLLFNTFLIWQSWATLPATIPIHFGLTGQPDSWGSKQTLWFLLAVLVVLYLMLTVINRFPHTFNYPYPITEQNALKQYQMACALIDWVKVELIWMFAFIEWQMIQVGLGMMEGINIAFLAAIMLIILGTIGFYFRQSYLAR